MSTWNLDLSNSNNFSNNGTVVSGSVISLGKVVDPTASLLFSGGGTSGGSLFVGLNSSQKQVAHPFTPSSQINITTASIYIKDTLHNLGYPTGGIYLQVQTNSGGNPSGTVLCTSNQINPSGYVTNTTVTFTFPETTLNSGTTYWLVVWATPQSTNGSGWSLGTQLASPMPSVDKFCSWGSWGTQNFDLWFQINGKGFNSYPTGTMCTVQTTATSDFQQAMGQKLDSFSVTKSEPTNTAIKTLVSFDGRTTWKYWNTNQWSTTTLSNIGTNGMSITALTAALTGYVFQTGETKLDLVFGLTTSVSNATPSISGVSLAYSVANHPPTAPIINDTTKYNLNTVIQLPAFTDPDGNTLTYSVSGLPSGMTFDPATRKIRGVAATTGQFAITMTANDGAGGVTNQGFLLTLNKVPTNTKIEDCFE